MVDTKLRNAVQLAVAITCSSIGAVAAQAPAASRAPTPVNVGNFVRAESDLYFGRYVKRGAFGTFFHERAMTPIDKQEIVRMNRDTLYSFAMGTINCLPITPGWNYTVRLYRARRALLDGSWQFPEEQPAK